VKSHNKRQLKKIITNTTMNQHPKSAARRRAYLAPVSEVTILNVQGFLCFSVNETNGTEKFGAGTNSYGEDSFDE
jgi:hypothetical protein